MYHIFFIHSSVDGQLGCFHVLAIVNSAIMNVGVHVSFKIMVFSRYTPRSGSYGSSIFSFLRNFVPIYIPTKSVGRSGHTGSIPSPRKDTFNWWNPQEAKNTFLISEELAQVLGLGDRGGADHWICSLFVRVCCVLELVSSLSPVLLLPPCRVVTKEAVPEGYLEEGFP